MTKIVFFGTPDYVVCVLEALKKDGHEIVAVVTQPPKPVGRKKILTSSPIGNWAKQNRVQVLNDTTSLRSGVVKQTGVGVLASYGKLVEKEVLEVFPKGIINIHPSLLPKWRGAAPIQEQVLAGEKDLGISLMLMDERMDCGPILQQITIPVGKDDTQETLLNKAFKKGSDMLVRILPQYLEGKIRPKPQDDSQATYTYTTSESKQKACFNIENPPSIIQLDRMVRAFYPWPNAWTKWDGKVIKLFPGRKIQMEGKNPVEYEEFRRSYPDFPLNLNR